MGIVETVEGDHPDMIGAGVRMPCHSLVRMLFGDGGIELTDLPCDIENPMRVGVVELTDLSHALHELRERLELRPLVVGDPDRNIDVDLFGDCAHAPSRTRLSPIPHESRVHSDGLGAHGDAHRVGVESGRVPTRSAAWLPDGGRAN